MGDLKIRFEPEVDITPWELARILKKTRLGPGQITILTKDWQLLESDMKRHFEVVK